MFKSIFLFEFKSWLKKPVFYVYCLVFFGIAFLSMAGTAGLFDPHSESGTLQRYVNSPFEINFVIQYFNKFFLFLLPAVIGATIYKDFKNDTHSIVYTFPIHKRDYFFGKFLSSFLIVVFITLCTGFGMLFAEQLPGLDPAKVGEFRWIGYLQAYLIYVLPNMLFYGAVVFGVVLWYRNFYSGFIVVILLFFVQIISENAFQGVYIALLDPFGQNTAKYITQLWTLKEQNFGVIPIAEVLVYNRLIWLLVSMLFLSYVYNRFTLSEHAIGSLRLIRKGTKSIKALAQRRAKTKLSLVRYDFSSIQYWKTVWRHSQFHLRFIVRSWMFGIISLLGILAVLFAIGKVTNTGEMTMLPTTGLVLTIPAFFFGTIIMLLTFIYSGMLVHRERASKMDSLVDSSPISNWALLLSKVLALLKMQVLLLLVMLIAGLMIQLYNGFYNFQLDIYLFHLFVILFVVLVIWTLTSVFIHTLFPKPYIGIFMLILVWVGSGSVEQLGIETRLLKFNNPGVLTYSDLNGYGSELGGYLLTECYWLFLAGILLVLANLLWFRGVSSTFKERLFLAKGRFQGMVKIVSNVLLVGFVVSGYIIYDKENEIVHESAKVQDNAFEQFKTEFGSYEGMLQPRIVSADLQIDLYPKHRNFALDGSYLLINKHDVIIDTLLIKTGFDEITSFQIDSGYEVIAMDPYFKFTVVKLNQRLAPNDSLRMFFSIKNRPNTFFEQNSSVLSNGTFLMTDILPRIGYTYGNSKLQPTDSLATKNHFQALDSDLVAFNTVVSTSKDQIAIAPGYLQKEWEKDDRRYFHYKMNRDIKFAFGVNSGNFEILHSQWKGVNLAIYHQKGHGHNLTSMMGGLRAAIDYNTNLFGPYQHKEARIVEFPMSRGSFATTMANSIPTSEIRFIANAEASENTIDIAFYVAAHELTHQWWGNQIIPANALGARFISESVTDYLTYCMYEKQFGVEEGKRWLEMQRQRYLKGRTHWNESEPPLYKVDEEQAIFYGKGTMAFHTMRHYLGEETLHGVLNDFLQAHKYKQTNYPTSVELLERLQTATPESLQYLVSDLFKTVTFYETKIADATLKKQTQNAYEVRLTIAAQKWSDGVLSPSQSNHLEIAFYQANGDLIQVENRFMSSEQGTFVIKLNQKPVKVVLDPNRLLIEKEREDNVFNF